MPRFFISLVAPGADRQPTDTEYQEFTSRTSTYFTTFLNTTYTNTSSATATDFVRLNLNLNNTRFELGVPEPRYNIYTDFVMDAEFAGDPASPAEIFDALVPAINANFILNEVRAISDSPFTTVNEAFMGAAVPL